jgi:undecaprenyl diphosphate synthase
VLVVAFNYGGKAEIAEATRRLAREVAAGRLSPEQITEQSIEAALYTAGMPDPDLIIRTSGEQRISNFLLWQAAYSEFVFVDEYWPDFDEQSFLKVLEIFSLRDRRFGGIGAAKP